MPTPHIEIISDIEPYPLIIQDEGKYRAGCYAFAYRFTASLQNVPEWVSHGVNLRGSWN